MNLLYWNLKSNRGLERIIKECLHENDVDIAVFSEFDCVDFFELKNLLGDHYIRKNGLGICKNVTMLCKSDIELSIIQEQQRYMLATVNGKERKYLLVGLHLPSNTHLNASSRRKYTIRKIVNDIGRTESDELIKITSSIVIGDMNASPFDPEMIEKDSFNSVLFKDIIRNNEVVKFQDDLFRRFYNPIINFLNENDKSYGSFYYGSGDACLYWYCYDQLLVRKDLIDEIKDYKYLKVINKRSLLKEVRPDSSISDHLPLFVSINI